MALYSPIDEYFARFAHGFSRLRDVYDVFCARIRYTYTHITGRRGEKHTHEGGGRRIAGHHDVTGAFNEHTFDILKRAPINRTKSRDNDLVDVRPRRMAPLVIVGMSTKRHAIYACRCTSSICHV